MVLDQATLFSHPHSASGSRTGLPDSRLLSSFHRPRQRRRLYRILPHLEIILGEVPSFIFCGSRKCDGVLSAYNITARQRRSEEEKTISLPKRAWLLILPFRVLRVCWGLYFKEKDHFRKSFCASPRITFPGTDLLMSSGSGLRSRRVIRGAMGHLCGCTREPQGLCGNQPTASIVNEGCALRRLAGGTRRAKGGSRFNNGS